MGKYRTKMIGLAVVVLALGSIGWMLLRGAGPVEPPAGAVAEIWVDGALYRTIVLAEAEDMTFSIEEDTGKPVSFELRQGAIRFVGVTCPDHICEHTGFVSSEGEIAVCMPNRTMVTVVHK